MLKGNRIPFFSDFAIRYNTDVPATPPTSANKIRRSGAIFSNPVGGGGGVGLITRMTLKYLKFGLRLSMLLIHYPACLLISFNLQTCFV